MAGQRFSLVSLSILIISLLIIQLSLLISPIYSSNDVVAGISSGGPANAKLNVRRVLLPINSGVPTNYTLEVVNGGCQIWTSSHPDIISVNSIENEPDCSTRAIISVASVSQKEPISVVVYAQNKLTAEILRCDVRVDVIRSIEIVTRTREIVLDDVPEEFSVRAKNDRNDTFTCLGGIEFEWTAEPVAGDHILRFKRFAHSHYKVPPSVEFWESRDSQGSEVLIEGIKTGTSKVRVRIKDETYASVPPSETVLTVVANLVFVPAHDVFLLPYSTVHYQVHIIKQGQAHKLTLPTTQYELQVDNKAIVSLDTSSSIVSALKEGSASIKLIDHNVDSSQNLVKPTSANIFVVRPSYLTLSVEPGGNWALQEMTPYIVQVKIFDVHHHRIHLSDNLDIRVAFPSNFFHVLESTQNGTYHLVKTLVPGSCTIKATLVGTTSRKFNTPVEVHQDVRIYESLKITPSRFLLPWDPNVKPSYNLKVAANGGTGSYIWVTNSTQLVTFNYRPEDSSKAAIITRGEGTATYACGDSQNSVFKDTGIISIRPITDIQILPSILETEIENSVLLPIALYGLDENSTRRVFDDCSRIPLDIEIVEKTRFEYEQGKILPGTGKACRNLSLKCLQVGPSRIWVRYTSGNLTLESTAVISCHLPLRVVHPNAAALLALGTSMEVAFEGGPRPFTLYPDGHFVRLNFEEESLVEYSHIIDPIRRNKDLHVFKVKCVKLGESKASLKVGNVASATLPNPAMLAIDFKVICSVPSSLHLVPKLKDPSKCEMRDSIPVPLHAERDISMQIIARDSYGKAFHNITSLKVEWQLSDYTVANLKSHNDFIEEVNGAAGFRRALYNYQTIMPKGKESQLTVKAKVTGYRTDILKHEGISSSGPDPNLEKEISLMLVHPASVDPSTIIIYNHPSSRRTIKVLKGSGLFSASTQHQGLVDVNFKAAQREVELIPKSKGDSFVRIYDLCLDPEIAIEVRTSVVDAVSIELQMISKIERGSTVEAQVNIISSNRQLIPLVDYKWIDLRPVVGEKNVISLLQNPENLSQWRVKGNSLGQVTLKFLGKGVISNVVNVNVFSPLKIQPSNLTLLVGSTFQITTSGGPLPDFAAKFTLASEDCAQISSSGLIQTQKLGSTQLTVEAIGPKNMILSRDTINVYVVVLHGVKIFSPQTIVEQNSIVPLFVQGLNEQETPMSFGVTDPPLIIEWTSANEEVAQIESVFASNGLSQSSHNNFRINLIAKQPGSTTISVKVRPSQPAAHSIFEQLAGNSQFKDTFHVKVFPRLSVNDQLGTTLLLSPGSDLQLQLNRKPEARTSAKLLPIDNTTSVSLQSGGLLKAGDLPMANALLITSSEENFGIVQRESFLVMVRPAQFLYVISETAIPVAKPIEGFPVGSTITLRVTVHDNIGRIFAAHRGQIRFSLSRTDLLQITQAENNTFIMRALNLGTTILRVYDSLHPHVINDFIPINVTQAIDAPPQLKVGQVAHLSSGLKKGSWSTDQDIVSIDDSNGIVLALRPGDVKVRYLVHDGASLETSATLSILPFENFSIDGTQLNGIPVNRVTKVPLIIHGMNDLKSSSLTDSSAEDLASTKLSQLELPFRCTVALSTKEVAAEELFSWSIALDLRTNTYSCKIVPLQVSTNGLILSTLESEVVISIYLLSSGERKTISLPLLPQFHVSSQSLTLSLDRKMDELTVEGTPKVLSSLSASPSADFVQAHIQHPGADGNDRRAQLIVKVNDRRLLPTHLNYPSHTAEIRLYSSESKQAQVLSVTMDMTSSLAQKCSILMGGGSTFIGFFPTDPLTLFLAGLMTMTCILAGYFWLNNKNKSLAGGRNFASPHDITNPFSATPHGSCRVVPPMSPSSPYSPRSSSPMSPRQKPGRPLYSVGDTSPY